MRTRGGASFENAPVKWLHLELGEDASDGVCGFSGDLLFVVDADLLDAFDERSASPDTLLVLECGPLVLDGSDPVVHASFIALGRK